MNSGVKSACQFHLHNFTASTPYLYFTVYCIRGNNTTWSACRFGRRVRRQCDRSSYERRVSLCAYSWSHVPRPHCDWCSYTVNRSGVRFLVCRRISLLHGCLKGTISSSGTGSEHTHSKHHQSDSSEEPAKKARNDTGPSALPSPAFFSFLDFFFFLRSSDSESSSELDPDERLRFFFFSL